MLGMKTSSIMGEPSNLPALRPISNSRSQLSNQPSFLSRSRRSTSSQLSVSSDLQSTGSSNKNKRPFKAISYFLEKRYNASQDVYHHYQRVMRQHKVMLTALIDEKSRISVAMTRERAHIDALNQENEAREASIRETLEVLRSSKPGKRIEGQPPSISQLRQLSNQILREGLKFKQNSEQPQRIERETTGAQNLNESSPFDIRQQPNEDESYEKIMEFQRTKLSNLVFKREDAKLRLETIMSNRDMLTRVIFDHKTALEALKLKKQNLTDEGKKLEKDFEQLLKEVASKLGELMWKNAMVKACNDVAILPKST